MARIRVGVRVRVLNMQISHWPGCHAASNLRILPPPAPFTLTIHWSKSWTSSLNQNLWPWSLALVPHFTLTSSSLHPHFIFTSSSFFSGYVVIPRSTLRGELPCLRGWRNESDRGITPSQIPSGATSQNQVRYLQYSLKCLQLNVYRVYKHIDS
jgi:hypothetical protein